jgi:hypothetical protein
VHAKVRAAGHCLKIKVNAIVPIPVLSDEHGS